MKKAGHPIANLKHWAHPPKSDVNFAKPPKAQTKSDSPKIIGPSGDRGKHSKPAMRKS